MLKRHINNNIRVTFYSFCTKKEWLQLLCNHWKKGLRNKCNSEKNPRSAHQHRKRLAANNIHKVTYS